MALENLLMLSVPGPESYVLPLLEEPKLDDTVISTESRRTKTCKGVKRLRVPAPSSGKKTNVHSRVFSFQGFSLSDIVPMRSCGRRVSDGGLHCG
eukprot:3830287-Amphidinium_carterae.1